MTRRQMPSAEQILDGWYFSAEDRKLRYGDGRLIEIGATHKVDCKPIPCKRGLHSSPTVLNALGYAPGPILWRTVSSGEIVWHEPSRDKWAATERTYTAVIDATPILREFARKCALSVIHLWDAPRVVRDYLESGDESLRAAAWAAAWAAARDAAWAAAKAAAAKAAASAAARDAARGAAWDAARDAQEKMLDEMVLAALAAAEENGK